MRKTFQFLFKVSCVLFLLSGSLLVIGQMVGLLLLNGDLIIFSADTFGKPTFILSTFAGLFGFALNYIPNTVPVDNSEPITQQMENSQSTPT
ncbi:hypothetical protein [Peribacillus sp. Hz7]|uniref:Uncharacterized protein n=2 Tax=Peribacillus asahii TaxID=228899 RepID=A0A398BIK5_9BACI|nr:hypothetical protein D1953_05110 [Peribacillus asahii]